MKPVQLAAHQVRAGGEYERPSYLFFARIQTLLDPQGERVEESKNGYKVLTPRVTTPYWRMLSDLLLLSCGAKYDEFVIT